MIKKIWFTGAGGQLGLSLRDVFYSMPYELVLTDIVESDGVVKLDIAEPGEIAGIFHPETRPDLIVNAAAFTNVDACEVNIKAADSANWAGPSNLAVYAREFKIPLLHISTDFVFAGDGHKPLKETDDPVPICFYGNSKLKGENAIITSGCQYWTIRTAWLFSEFGMNFVKKIIELAKTHDHLDVVNDQVGSPTYARDLAVAILGFVEHTNAGNPPPFGLYHFANGGQATWHNLAERSVELAGLQIPVMPQTFAEYCTKSHRDNPDKVIAPRPAYSVLDTSKITAVLGYAPRHWVDAHTDCMTRINAELD